MAPDATVLQGSGGNYSGTTAPGSPTILPDWRSISLRNVRDLLGLIAVLALATNFLYFSYFRSYSYPDTQTYRTPASNLINGHGFADPLGYPETFVPPGYPLLIALFLRAGLDLKYLVLLQHLLHVLLATATTAAAFKLTGSRRPALIAGILVSIDLPMLDAANHIITDISFTTILTIVLWLLWTGSRQSEARWSNRLFFSGLLAGAATLIKPINQFFFLPVIIYLLATRKRSRLWAVICFVLPCLCLPFLWAARNYREAGYFGVTSLPGIEVLCCRASGVLALDDPGDFNTNASRRRAQMENVACDQVKRLYGKDCSELSFAQKSPIFMRVGRKVLMEHLFGLVRLTFRGAALVLLDGGASSLPGIINPHLAIKLLLIYTLPAFSFAVAGLWKLWTQNRQFSLLALLTVGYFVLLASGAESYSRYRVPVVPVYSILTAIGIEGALTYLRKQKSHRSIETKVP
ncbi:MAG TPA: glycosyltransferase family 39 protein [Candidatus Angelobacter sp.]